MKFHDAATKLMATFQRQTGIEPDAFARTNEYRQFAKAAEQDGFTGPDIEMDMDFASRSPKWVMQADKEALKRWVHTLLRSDRSNGDYPTAVLDACQSGCMDALVERLAAQTSF